MAGVKQRSLDEISFFQIILICLQHKRMIASFIVLYFVLTLWSLGCLSGWCLCVLGNPFPGFKVLLVNGNLVGLEEMPGVDGLFVVKDVDFTFESREIQYQRTLKIS